MSINGDSAVFSILHNYLYSDYRIENSVASVYFDMVETLVILRMRTPFVDVQRFVISN